MDITIEEMCRRLLEQASEDGLVTLDADRHTSGDLAGVANTLASFFARLTAERDELRAMLGNLLLCWDRVSGDVPIPDEINVCEWEEARDLLAKLSEGK